MIIATLLAGAVLQAALPAPPEPPLPPSAVAAPTPPLPPMPPRPPSAQDDQQVMSFNDDGRHVTIIKRRSGQTGVDVSARSNNVLTYRDASGRDVTVFSDKPMTQAQVEAMQEKLKTLGPEIAREMRGAKLNDEQIGVITRHAREQAADAVRQSAEARAQGEAARREGEKAREYAQVIVRQMKEANGSWRFDAGPSTGVYRQGEFAGAADMKELRDEMRALRAEMEELRAQLKSGLDH